MGDGRDATGVSPAAWGLRVGAALIAGCALLYVAVPFSFVPQTTRYVLGSFAPAPSGELSASSVTVPDAHTHCGAALVDAWRSPSHVSGWFGYAPLTTRVSLAGSCRAESRHRLGMSALALVVALGLVLAARSIGRRPGTGSDPAPGPVA